MVGTHCRALLQLQVATYQRAQEFIYFGNEHKVTERNVDQMFKDWKSKLQ